MPGPQIVLIEDRESLAPHIAGWDALAVERERPFCAPSWMLAWWTAYTKEGMGLRVALAFDDGELIAVAPFFASTQLGLTELRLLGAGFSHRIGILAKAGCQERIASPLAAALAAVRPRPASVVFEGIESEDPWPALIARGWPSRLRAVQRRDGEMQAPVIRLDGSYEEWMERRERHFRKEARRLGRRLEEQGVSARTAADERAVDTLLTLHHERWSDRGGSNVQASARQALLDAVAASPSPQRLFVALLEARSGPVAAELVARAGASAAFWGGGFDPRWAQQGPGMQTMLFALRQLAEDGVRTADLGGGEHRYKQRMADETTTLVWRTVFPRGWRYPLIRLRLAPKHVRLGLRAGFRRLPDSWQGRLEAALRARRPGPR